MRMRENPIAPAFFIGLGGCGGAIVNELARKVKQEPSFDRYAGLVHFFALDTDADDLASQSWIDSGNRFILSDFDKREYVELKQGKLHAKEDPLFTQWWPSYYRPRGTRGKGAGQIRIESRLAMYHHLENDNAKILETFEKAIRTAYDIHNPFRAPKAATIHIYASLAGGTGSGGFATMAYTLRRLLGGERGHQLVGTFVLPNVFRSKGLPPNQFDKIMANGYSALQELELLQGASPDSPLVFHYDPDHPENGRVDRPPFDQIYLVEEKTASGVVIADATQVYPAIADAAHAHLFTSISAKEGSTLDNDTRELMQRDDQAFTKGFGSFGVAALVLPTADILTYAATRMGIELLRAAVPGGAAALGQGTQLDLESADQAFTAGFEATAQRGARGDADAAPFLRAVEWVRGGGAGGEGAVGGFLRRCNEVVARQVDGAIRLRVWDDAELGSFEKDPARVASETASAWSALEGQIAKSEEAARAQARSAAEDVATGSGDFSLQAMAKGKGPTDTRYLYAILRQAVLSAQTDAKTAYDRGIGLRDARVQDDFRRKVDELQGAAPETFMEKLPGRENDYFEVASGFASWYRDVVGAFRARVRANAMLEFFSLVLKEIDRRRAAAFQFFAQVDRACRALEQDAARLLAEGGARAGGGESNAFVLDVEILQDHTTGQRLWEHLYHRVVKPSDLQLSGALAKLAEVSSGVGGDRTEQEILRDVTAELRRIGEQALGPRIVGDREANGLLLHEELEFEARVVLAGKRMRRDGVLPPAGDPAWADELRRVDDAEVASYVKDKLNHTASKCQPFVTPNVGAPLLPDKAYVVVPADSVAALGEPMSRLASMRIDKQQIIAGEEPHRVIFYYAQLGIPLHAVKSMNEYERRYLAVKAREVAEASTVAGLPAGVPQIPIHQDSNWEGAPDPELRLFRISMDGIKANDSKIAYDARLKKRRARTGEAAITVDDLRDFTLGVAFGLIEHKQQGAAGEGYYLTDMDLSEAQRRLGKFRDQAFNAYHNAGATQKAWLRHGYQTELTRIDEEREYTVLKTRLDAHVAELLRLVKVADASLDKAVSAHLTDELESVQQFRKERGC